FAARHVDDLCARRPRRNDSLAKADARTDVRRDDVRQRGGLPRNHRGIGSRALREGWRRALERQAGRRHRERLLGRGRVSLRGAGILVLRAARGAERRARRLLGPVTRAPAAREAKAARARSTLTAPRAHRMRPILLLPWLVLFACGDVAPGGS